MVQLFEIVINKISNIISLLQKLPITEQHTVRNHQVSNQLPHLGKEFG